MDSRATPCWGDVTYVEEETEAQRGVVTCGPLGQWVSGNMAQAGPQSLPSPHAAPQEPGAPHGWADNRARLPGTQKKQAGANTYASHLAYACTHTCTHAHNPGQATVLDFSPGHSPWQHWGVGRAGTQKGHGGVKRKLYFQSENILQTGSDFKNRAEQQHRRQCRCRAGVSRGPGLGWPLGQQGGQKGWAQPALDTDEDGSEQRHAGAQNREELEIPGILGAQGAPASSTGASKRAHDVVVGTLGRLNSQPGPGEDSPFAPPCRKRLAWGTLGSQSQGHRPHQSGPLEHQFPPHKGGQPAGHCGVCRACGT